MKISVFVTALRLSLFLVLEEKVSAREVPATMREIQAGVRGQTTEDYRALFYKRKLQMEDKPCRAGMMETCEPSSAPSEMPSAAPTSSHAPTLSFAPSVSPSQSPAPSFVPTLLPSVTPSASEAPSPAPSSEPSEAPIIAPSLEPSPAPSASPTARPSAPPTFGPTVSPSRSPSSAPSSRPSQSPTRSPAPSTSPTGSSQPTSSPAPTIKPSQSPSLVPSTSPAPSAPPTGFPTPAPSISAAPSFDPDGFTTRIAVDENGDIGVTSTCRRDPPADTTAVVDQLIGFDYILNVEPGADLSFILPSLADQIHDKVAEEHLDCRYEEGAPFYVYEESSLPRDTANSTGCTTGNQEVGGDCYVINAGFTLYVFEYAENRRQLSEVITDRDILKVFKKSLETIFASGAIGGANVISIQYLGISNDEVPPIPKRDITAEVVGGVIAGLCLIALVIGAMMLGTRRQRQRTEYEEQVQALEDIDAAIQSDDEIQSLNSEEKFVMVDEEASYGSGIQIFPGKSKKEVKEPTFFVPTDDMISSIQADLGPTTYSAQSPRQYGASDTVDL